MDVKIDFTLSAQQNADNYYKNSKKLAAKKKGAESAVAELEKRLEELRRRQEPSEERAVVRITTKEWYEKFHWFFTSEGKLVVGGRDAQQNELLNAKHFDSADLFFHADIFGASAVILKGGAGAGIASKEEAAQFAACYSSAWERMLSSIDVYMLKREQVSKSTNRGSLGTGSFLLKGEREWFKGVELELAAFLSDNRLNVVPKRAFDRLAHSGSYALIKEGTAKKSDAAKALAKAIGYDDIDAIMRSLPAGSFNVTAFRA
ncbi:MAG: NFACT RNA binding domain-containing protein [Candidatus Micrarchaeia archaeon]